MSETTQQFIAEDMHSFIASLNAGQIQPEVAEIIADTRLQQHVAILMREKLAISRAKGKGGWWRSKDCSIEFLRGMLQVAIQKGDMVDIINFAAMIHIRTAMEQYAG